METEEIIRGRGKNKQFWTTDETKALIEALQKLASDTSNTWKTDGGSFKNNYMLELHKIILDKIPSFSKKISPHLESKIRWLKNRYHVITKMCKESGCSWNDVEHKIDCDQQWYENWCKKHKEAKGLWNFQFPYLRDLDIVYGTSDRELDAIDEVPVYALEAPGDAEQNMKNIHDVESGDHGCSRAISSSSDSEPDVNEELNVHKTPTTTSTTNMSGTKSKRPVDIVITKPQKKQKEATPEQSIGSDFKDLVGKLETFMEGLTSHLGAMAAAINNDDKRAQMASERMYRLVNELIGLGLKGGDLYKVAKAMSKDPIDVDLFFSLPTHMKKDYVNGFR
ncbi:OLC1v1018945C1 [Oldenlandia corymbosa var. corymbosa]|uniref:OLC1v1018945C1 n=1 Tax=Oldenlandia corymbosa var. corymbosa TaxID=529605 RepID=A0AAV1ECY0_OLDCO|nr:OLC1v1018945C1 [Oldenlandia corymbosa var. corymbosa]